MHKKILFIVGFLLLAIPILFQYLEQKNQNRIVTTFQEEIAGKDKAILETYLSEARDYNERLFQAQRFLSEDFLSEEDPKVQYENLLCLSKDGIMGTLEIPKISLRLPIYHGISEKVLARGIGHVKDSSLPVGGKNSHAILTGHRGVPSAQLFTRLDEIEMEDVFFLKVCNEVLTYRVKQIRVVEPEEAEKLEIRSQKDLVSLVTCTPYGLNTHRLIVTGEFVEETKDIKETKAGVNFMSKREILLILVLLIFLILALRKWLYKIQGKSKGKLWIVALFLVLVNCPINSLAAEGTIELLLPNSNQKRVSVSKVADMKGDQFILCEEYKESGLDFNKLNTAAEMNEAAKKLVALMRDPVVFSARNKERVVVTGLEAGVYLLQIEGKDKWNPILVSVPTWMETEEEMSYHVTVVPKGMGNPKTGDVNLVAGYVVLLLLSFLVGRKIIAHKKIL